MHCTCLISISETIIQKIESIRREVTCSLVLQSCSCYRDFLNPQHGHPWLRNLAAAPPPGLGPALHLHRGAQRNHTGGAARTTPWAPARPITRAISPPKAYFHMPEEHSGARAGKEPKLKTPRKGYTVQAPPRAATGEPQPQFPATKSIKSTLEHLLD